jgi:hypothetical protein
LYFQFGRSCFDYIKDDGMKILVRKKANEEIKRKNNCWNRRKFLVMCVYMTVGVSNVAELNKPFNISIHQVYKNIIMLKKIVAFL